MRLSFGVKGLSHEPVWSARSNTVIIRYKGNQGIVAGLFGCVLGILGIFSWGIVFVPLAAICSLVGLIRGIIGPSVAGIGCSLLGGALTAWGFISSPSLWILLGASILATHQPAPVVSPPSVPSASFAQPRPAAPPPQQASPQSGFTAAQGTPEALKQAGLQAHAAITECINKRLSGELKTHIASAKCSNPRIMAAYQAAGYRYMDLIYQLTAKRLELAERLDNGTLTDAQSQLAFAQFMTDITDEERRRDRGQR